MAYVQPCGTIQLFKNINLDNRYMHTIYFENEADQRTWFDAKVTSGLTLQAHTYQRPSTGTIKVAINAEKLIGVSYLRFNNAGSTAEKPNGVNITDRTFKWYYAFVNNIEYVNEKTAIISYEIDVMQTWFIQNGTIQPCLVERNHVATDTFGLYQTDEMDAPHETYTSINVSNDALFGAYQVVIETTAQPSGYWRENAFSGVTYESFPETESGADDIVDYLEQQLGSWDKNEQSADVIDMYSFPSSFCNNTIGANTYDITLPIPSQFNYDGVNYTPHNKRLLGYPFSSLVVTNNSGSANILKWELFDWEDNTPAMRIMGTSIGGGSISAIPMNYDGLTLNYDSGVTINDFPKRAYAYDAYQAWVASGGQTKTNASWDIAKLSIANGVIETLQSGAHAIKSNWMADMHGLLAGAELMAGAKLGNAEIAKNSLGTLAKSWDYRAQALNQGVDTFQQGLSTYASYKEAKNKRDFAFNDAQYQANYVVGKQNSNLMAATRGLKFVCLNMFPTYHEACRLDELLTIYGYAIKRVQVPSLACRKYWTFVKTKDCQITGEMPASSKEAIGNIFDGGIFFWRKNATIGKFDAQIDQGTIYNPIQV